MPARLSAVASMLAALAVGGSLRPYGSYETVSVVQQAPAQCGGEVGLSSKFGRPVGVDFTLHGGYPHSDNFLPTNEAQPHAIRLALRALPTPGARWTLNVRDSGLRLLATYSAFDFGSSGGRIWTGRFAVPNLAVELLDARDGDKVLIEKAIYYDQPGAGGSLFSTAVEGVPNWQPLADRKQWAEARMGDPVGMMVASAVTASGSSQSWCCSGVMVTPTLYLTNWHCGGAAPTPGALLWEGDMRETALVDLGWDNGPRNRQYRANEVVAQSEALDFALVRVASPQGQGGDDVPVRPARLALQLPAAGSVLKLIHHPLCQPKRISFTNCKVGQRAKAWRARPDGSVPSSDFAHGCDTEAGSSGGPLFDSQGSVVGLHHLGFELNAQCSPTRKENRGVAIDVVLDEIARIAPTIHGEIMSAQRR